MGLLNLQGLQDSWGLSLLGGYLSGCHDGYGRGLSDVAGVVVGTLQTQAGLTRGARRKGHGSGVNVCVHNIRNYVRKSNTLYINMQENAR